MVQLQQAYKLKIRQEAVFAQFTAKFAPEVVDRWAAMIDAWETDHQKPNPYEDVGKGRLSLLVLIYLALILVLASTMAQVRLELAEEELDKAKRGSAPNHDILPNVFLQLGLELEEQQ